MSRPDDYDDDDMAAVGRGLMAAIETAMADRDGPLFGWHPAQCPSEVVGDLIRMVLEARGGTDPDISERVARILWDRFAPSHAMEWRDETHKAEYRRCAADVLSEIGSAMRTTRSDAAREIIDTIVSASRSIAFGAGVDETSIAGMFVSCLAADPALIDRLPCEGSGLFMDGRILTENGVLTYLAADGKVRSPTELRRAKGTEH